MSQPARGLQQRGGPLARAEEYRVGESPSVAAGVADGAQAGVLQQPSQLLGEPCNLQL